MEDIPELDRARAEMEADKFLLDAECLRIYIEFNRRKAEDPEFVVPVEEQKEGFFSSRTFLILYFVFIGYTYVPNAFRKYVEKKTEEGEWHGSGVPFIDQWLENASKADIAEVSDQVTAVLNSEQVSSALDSAPTLDVSAVSDHASTLLDTLSSAGFH